MEKETRKLNEVDYGQIASQVMQGMTSGILDDEEGYRISWELKTEVAKH